MINPTEGLVETCRRNRKIGPVLTVEEIKGLVSQPNMSTRTGIRDRAIMEVLYAGFGDSKYRPCPLLKRLVRAGLHGAKTGRGFFSYDSERHRTDRLPDAVPLIRIETPREFYDYEAKYESDDTRYFCPCGLPADQEAALRERALRAFDLLGASGWGRVDFLLDDAGEAWFLEVNTTPGMTGHSLVPQAAAAVGIGFDELVWRILETSL